MPKSKWLILSSQVRSCVILFWKTSTHPSTSRHLAFTVLMYCNGSSLLAAWKWRLKKEKTVWKTMWSKCHWRPSQMLGEKFAVVTDCEIYIVSICAACERSQHLIVGRQECHPWENTSKAAEKQPLWTLRDNFQEQNSQSHVQVWFKDNSKQKVGSRTGLYRARCGFLKLELCMTLV